MFKAYIESNNQKGITDLILEANKIQKILN
jgi:hypothetical protein